MSEYKLPPTLPPEVSGLVDPEGGFLCMTVHWRPNPKGSDPDMPGEKMSMVSYIPVLPGEDCLCGSGKLYRACCRRQRFWHPVCPNPGLRGYSLLAPQTATFHPVDGPIIRERLMSDPRLRCVDESLESSFWIYWGDPALEDEYGILCFGDLELKDNHTLLVTAMSDLRMQMLLDLLQEIAEDCLGSPRMRYDQVHGIDKRTGKTQVRSPKGKRRRRRRKR
jgi:hypothetical protein